MGVTVKEIAEMAGVHRSTVDKVLHNRPGVSDPVRRRVQKIIDDCNYQVNPIGKALKMQDRVINISIILMEVDAIDGLRRGMEQALSGYESFQVNLSYTVLPYGQIDLQREALAQCIEDRVDGVILMPFNCTEVQEAIDACVDKGIPVVTVNRDIHGSKRFFFVGEESFKAGRLAGSLMGRFLGGNGRVAILSSNWNGFEATALADREEGFRQLMEQTYPDVTLLPGIQTEEDPEIMYRETKKLCEKEPDLDGIFITCGQVGSAGKALIEEGREDMELICYERYPEIVDLLQEDVVTATLDSGIEDQGQRALGTLLDYLIFGTVPPHKHLYTETQILLKESL